MAVWRWSLSWDCQASLVVFVEVIPALDPARLAGGRQVVNCLACCMTFGTVTKPFWASIFFFFSIHETKIIKATSLLGLLSPLKKLQLTVG